MCMPKAPSPPPAPEPVPTPVVSKATVATKQNAPTSADSSGSDSPASNYQRKKIGRGSLRIPMAGLTGSGLNFPTS